MKFAKRIYAIVLTFLLIIVGLFLPNLSSSMLDHHLSTQIKQMDNNSISLSLSDNMEILESVDLFYKLLYNDDKNTAVYDTNSVCGNFSAVELSEYSQVCRLNEQKVKQLAAEVINDIAEERAVIGEPTEVTPNLLIRSNNDIAVKSGIYWRCLWIDSESQANAAIWLDDKSGQMVGLMLDYKDDSNDEIPQIVYDLGKYCLVHYQADQVHCRKETDEYYFIEVTVKNGSEDIMCSIPIRWQNKELIFFNN